MTRIKMIWNKVASTRALYLKHQVNRFVILFVGRTGSSYLLSLLEKHPEIRAFGEETRVLKEKGSAAQLAWINASLTTPAIGRYGAVGFKTKLVDVIDHLAFADILKDHQAHIIHMRRRNRVKAVVSRINAQRIWELTNRWNLYNEQDKLPPLEITPSEFNGLLEEREAVENELDNFVKRLELPVLVLYYEDLLVRREAVLRQVYDYLGVRNYPAQADTLKNTSDDLREVIVNFDQLRAQYAGTPYEPMFDEVLASEKVNA